jgi:hypothetical protein
MDLAAATTSARIVCCRSDGAAGGRDRDEPDRSIVEQTERLRDVFLKILVTCSSIPLKLPWRELIECTSGSWTV